MKIFMAIMMLIYLVILSNITGWATTKTVYEKTFVFGLLGSLYISIITNLILIMTKM